MHLGPHAGGDGRVEPFDERLDERRFVLGAQFAPGVEGGAHVLADVVVFLHVPSLHPARGHGIGHQDEIRGRHR
ncbi:hypothetical protein Ppa06_47400 [Planomonospora parontospora subsp. parontospora]|uniref:Uncharacterized protein n=2 Tax=Planomonospora parontospora TaxID=58119 RepID=A0AA37BKI0_9ACTN|nr:hypothetical protein GCM10010126_47210 [Planomonospora parontospora]GII10942.1 hypothetical protein Ppa06_47400 [Planomonospora parontospora subsp. parontospora]